MYNKNESTECEQHWIRCRIPIKPEFTSVFTLGILLNNPWFPHLQNKNIPAAYTTGLSREATIYGRTMQSIKVGTWSQGDVGNGAQCVLWHYHLLCHLGPVNEL